ncbi:hypothetical protein BNJ_00455 [Kaumoebavirus]|uniref:hypothetical protein n=1 Tax=Kaumoebavirus TaxID=1859492 RepID=UPI0009C2E423|nr:hypothetical protein BNJ_00455 [Kaumoebavirus]ARA72267.1 hypothetical protein BNJ_00455 [Kaumoebavirus]
MKCENCDKKFKSKKLFKSHVDKKVCYPRVCHVCDKSFISDADLRRHEKTKVHMKMLEENSKPDIDDVLKTMKEKADNHKKEMISMVGSLVKDNPGIKVNNELLKEFIESLGGNVKIEIKNIINNFNLILPEGFIEGASGYLQRLLNRNLSFEEILKNSTKQIVMNNRHELTTDGEKVQCDDVSYNFTDVITKFKEILKIKLELARGFYLSDIREIKQRIREKEVDEDDVKHNEEKRREMEKYNTLVNKVNSMLLSIPSVLEESDMEKINRNEVIKEFLKAEKEVDQILVDCIPVFHP